jgi:membrane-bound serine protease (ClpP class)
MNNRRWWWYVWVMALLCAGLARGAAAQGTAALVLTLNGALTTAHVTYLGRGLERAEEQGAELVILQLNTPGGEIERMDQLVALIRESAVPVVVYVSPRGANAASAGTVITLAGHASAMAPETTIGAASPVTGAGGNLDSTLDTKVKEVLKAKVRSLAAGRPPEAIALAEATIESARAATAAEAHAIGLVDFLADDVPGLLRQLDGFEVQVGGQRRALETTGLSVVEAGMNLVEQVLLLLTNPNLVFLLLTIGTQAILIEIASPGGWVAGFVGAVCLALAFYGLGVLPVNWFGLIFIGLAFVLFILEANAPTHGALAAAGTAALIAGGLVLFNSPGSPAFLRVSVPLVVATSLILAAAFIAVVTFALRAQHRPAVVGVEALIGREGEVRGAQLVHVAGEDWQAEPADSGAPLQPGQRVVVAGRRGLTLLVRPK